MHLPFLFFGQHTPFSYAALTQLLSIGAQPRCVVVGLKQGGEHPFLLEQYSRQQPKIVRQQIHQPYSLKPLCAHYRIDLLESAHINSYEVAFQLKQYMPELIAVVGFPHLLSEEILHVPRLGGINAHPSVLPRWRGPTPFFWIYKEQDWESAGVTLHKLDTREDHGNILSQKHFSEAATNCVHDYLQWAGTQGAMLAGEIIMQQHCYELPAGEPQNHHQAIRAPRPDLDDLAIDLSWDIKRIQTYIHAICPPYEVPLDLGHDRFFIDKYLDTIQSNRHFGQFMVKKNVLFWRHREGVIKLRFTDSINL